jgi:hypothetical protein
MASAPAGAVDNQVARDPEEPVQERRLAAEPVERAPRPDEGLLHDLAGVLGVVELAERPPVEGGVVG